MPNHGSSFGNSAQSNYTCDGVSPNFGFKREYPEDCIQTNFKIEDCRQPPQKAPFLQQSVAEEKPQIPSLLQISTFKPLEKRTEPIFDDSLVLLDYCKYTSLQTIPTVNDSNREIIYNKIVTKKAVSYTHLTLPTKA